MMMLLTLRGTPILYYGDEIGMSDVALPHDRLRDPVGLRGWPVEPGRDRARTPMAWTGGPNLGFTLPGVEPWLPPGPPTANVADQRDDPDSILNLTRASIALRRARPDLREGRYATVEAPDGIWVWRRGNDTLVALNHSDGPIDADLGRGEIMLSSHADRAGERIDQRVLVEPWEALVIAQQTEG
jgi:alpha-glucosidase